MTFAPINSSTNEIFIEVGLVKVRDFLSLNQLKLVYDFTMVDYERHKEIFKKKRKIPKKSSYGVQTTPRERHNEKNCSFILFFIFFR